MYWSKARGVSRSKSSIRCSKAVSQAGFPFDGFRQVRTILSGSRFSFHRTSIGSQCPGVRRSYRFLHETVAYGVFGSEQLQPGWSARRHRISATGGCDPPLTRKPNLTVGFLLMRFIRIAGFRAQAAMPLQGGRKAERVKQFNRSVNLYNCRPEPAGPQQAPRSCRPTPGVAPA